jgi:hypothetical protein
VSIASIDSFSHPKKDAKSHGKSQTKTIPLSFTPEKPFSILQPEQDAQPPKTSEISTRWQENKKFP